MSPDQQAILNIIAILVDKLGGDIVISGADRVSAPEAVVTNNPDGSLRIQVKK